MGFGFRTAWEEMVKPMFQRPYRVQVAALCHRDAADGRQILMITSRGTGRWILPKGWPIDGLNGAESALLEAWEEAGVADAEIDPVAIGQYHYSKVLDFGGLAPVEAHVYSVRVKELASDYPEASQRTRRWVTPLEAAGMVKEPELQEILRAF